MHPTASEIEAHAWSTLGATDADATNLFAAALAKMRRVIRNWLTLSRTPVVRPLRLG